ncbi:MAG: helix-turn-helix domain-containing protein [Candidatus Rokuibacteriota bacterium]
MVPLERLLDGLDVAVEPLRVHDLTHEWSRLSGRFGGPSVYYTLSGNSMLELTGGATVRCSRYSVIVVPPRPGARIVSEGGASRRPFEPIGPPGDPEILVASGRIRATYKGSIDLFDHLPEPLVETLAPNDPIRRSFEELLDEIAASRPGCRAMTEALLRRCLILVLRRHCEHAQNRLSWLAALEDTRLGRAVAAMQSRPDLAYTLPRLAEVAGMSRSVFAARFADALGQSPIEFLKSLRLARAAQLLTRTDLPVKSVAARVGYSSRSSFTRAFAARHGLGPTAFRAAASGPEPGPPRRMYMPRAEVA